MVIRARNGGMGRCSTGGTGKGGKGLGATGSAPTSKAPAATVSATGPQVTPRLIFAPAAAAEDVGGSAATIARSSSFAVKHGAMRARRGQRDPSPIAKLNAGPS